MTIPEADLDGRVIFYEAAPPLGRSKRILHVNGVASDVAKQHRDLETLVWLTLERPFDVMGIHNSTQGIQADLTESLLGKAELYRFWPEHRLASSQKRLSSYAEILRSLCDQSLAPDADILAAAKGSVKGLPSLDMDLLRRLTSLSSLSWDDLENTLYGMYPAGAPRPTLRLAYEIATALRTGAEVYVVAHSQGLIITALALHIVQQFFGDYSKWAQTLRVIGYGPAIMFEDLPAPARLQAILIQHRQDHVAESFSNLRNVNLWNNLQNQARNLVERADSLIQIIGTDSHHSASLYLGLTGDPAGDRSAKLIQQLLLGNWDDDPVIQSLRSTRIIIEGSH
ncbi:hypothetical protein [Altericista sp. CCNU0014]|uniref:hypothetical protein n=1 Tax=Altericista sp. CCNU0014 TaxID=3082949 RepID=UPI00384D9C8A